MTIAALSLFLAVLQEPAPEERPRPEPLLPAEERESSVTGTVLDEDGREIPYRARAGTLVLREESGEAKATIFYFDYLRTDVDDPAERPITFCFNGGPGSSSVWLHLGLLGPRRVALEPDGLAPPPPGRLADNPHTLLDRSDLVFVDPVTTGYSRAAEGEDPAQFHGLEEDARWVAEFVRLYVTRNERWASPKLLAGESYGSTRAAALAGELQQRHGMYLNGIVLVSSILSFQTARFDTANDLPYALFLPTYAATAWYHGALAPELQERDLGDVLAEAEELALGDYWLALARGDSLPGEERSETARRIARLTGLSPEYVEHTELRVRIHRFAKELLRGRDRTVGRLDSRFLGIDRDAAGEGYEFDPSYANIQGPYTAALNHYVRTEIGFETDVPYEILTGRVHPWSYGGHENRYVDVAETLRREMSRNPHLRVFVASGTYDMATPYLATRYTLDHMQLDPELRRNVSTALYRGGHMMYIDEEVLARLDEDLERFVDEAAGGS